MGDYRQQLFFVKVEGDSEWVESFHAALDSLAGRYDADDAFSVSITDTPPRVLFYVAGRMPEDVNDEVRS
jgi:hypothetical protein